MAKFTSFDGIDSHGIRAEVVVQTGTGTIAELNPRGKANPDGTYRNIEVVFTPDNPKLVRKVYGMLDTTAKELWDYIQKVHAEKTNVAFRIESQRKRFVDRSKPFAELAHAEEVIRVIAAIDDVFSHEALTDPAEDPTTGGRAPSAREHSPAAVPAVVASASMDPGGVLTALGQARNSGLSPVLVDALAAQALASGASMEQVLSAGLDNHGRPNRPAMREYRASEEKPWMLYNSDGRVNPGSYWVAHVAGVQRFCLDYCATHHADLDVSSATGLTEIQRMMRTVLAITDQVIASVFGGEAERQKNSYNRVLAMVYREIEVRADLPVGAKDTDVDAWMQSLIDVVAMQLTQVMFVAESILDDPQTLDSPTEETAEPATEQETVQAPVVEAAVETTPVVDAEPSGAQALADAFDAVPLPEADRFAPFVARAFPEETSASFEVPDVATVGRLKTVCEQAGVTSQPKLIADWLEKLTGVRSARKVHQPVLSALVAHYEAMPPEVVMREIREAPVAEKTAV